MIETHPSWMNEEALRTLSSGYLLPGETVRDMYSRLSHRAAQLLEKPELESDFFEIFWNGWFSPASPVASNFGTNRGLPISCYSVHLSDSVYSIYSHLKEVAALSKYGGGVGVYFGDVRPSGSPISGGGKSTGTVPWAQQYDLAAKVVSQGGVRRGSFAIYIPIDHPDLPELLLSKDHSQGDPRKFIDSNIAVTITDSWIESMISGDKQKQSLFAEIMKIRMVSGSPYIIFIDNVNNQNPECYKERGLNVSTSNLCSEITLYTDESHSFVCCLSSLNLARYDEWRRWRSPLGYSVPYLGTLFLDAVMEEFIRKADKMNSMGRAVRFAKKSRPLGMGTMGLHTLYQKRGVPFKSIEARALNVESHKFIRSEAEKASRNLAIQYGEPEWCQGSGMRNSHLLAIAPTRTNSIISNAGSNGIEPIDNNYFVNKTAKGNFVRKNPQLENLLELVGKNTQEVWDSILEMKGSVQHLDVLTDEQKQIFLTAREIDQFELIKQAADRQPFICQAQSLNLFVDPEVPADELIRLHLSAWKNGVKSLYYLKSSSLLTKTKSQIKIEIITKEGCPYCDLLKLELTSEGKTFKEIDLSEAKEAGIWNPEWKTVPQLFINSERIGGYTDYMSRKKSNSQDTKYNECTACEA